MNLKSLIDTIQKILHVLDVVFDKVVDIAFYVAAFLILGVALIVGYEVLMRRVFNAPTSWVLQSAGFALAFITFFSVTKILKEDGHTRMTVVIENLPRKPVAILNFFTAAISTVVCALLTWRTALSTYQGYDWGLVIREGYEIPQYWVWWVMPFGFFLLTIQFIKMTVRYRREIKS